MSIICANISENGGYVKPYCRVLPLDGWERMRDWIWFLRATSHEMRKSSLTRENLFAGRFVFANSIASFLHFEAQMRLNFVFIFDGMPSVSVGVVGVVNVLFMIVSISGNGFLSTVIFFGFLNATYYKGGCLC